MHQSSTKRSKRKAQQDGDEEPSGPVVLDEAMLTSKGKKRAATAESVTKRTKYVPLTIDMFDNDAAAWFEALHEAADPTLTKLERGTTENPVRHIIGSVWDAMKNEFGGNVPDRGEGPVALILSASADRNCIVARDLKRCPGAIAKLFARHMKVQEQAAFLEKHKVGSAVGTPNRVLKLCQDSILKLDKLRFLVIDMFVDSKTFTVLSMPDVSKEFFKFYRDYIAPLGKKVKVVLVTPPPTERSNDDEAKGAKQQKQNGKNGKPKGNKQMKIIIKDELPSGPADDIVEDHQEDE